MTVRITKQNCRWLRATDESILAAGTPGNCGHKYARVLGSEMLHTCRKPLQNIFKMLSTPELVMSSAWHEHAAEVLAELRTCSPKRAVAVLTEPAALQAAKDLMAERREGSQ